MKKDEKQSLEEMCYNFKRKEMIKTVGKIAGNFLLVAAILTFCICGLYALMSI